MASPDKRTSVKTAKYNSWKADITKSHAKGDMIARGKNIRAEEEELAAQEADAEYTEESPVKKALKPKGKAPAKQAAPRPESPPGDGDVSEDNEEARNLAQVKADEKRCLELQFKIYARDQTPIDKLMAMDLPELEKLWENNPSGASSGKAKRSTAPAKKDWAAPPKKAPKKTPARVRVTKPSVSKVTPLDSPLVAFSQAREQSMLADSTPVPAKRTRDSSVDRGTDIRRQRLDFAKSGTSQTINRTASADKPTATTTTSRAGSMAPSAVSVRSQSSAPSKSTSRGGTVVDNECEFFDLDIGHGEIEDEIEEVRPVASRKKGQKIGKDPKPRPKKRDYEDDPETLMVIDRTVEETVALLVSDMCCDELDIPIRRGWARAVKHLHLPPEKWNINQHLINVCKTLVSGFRSRGRQHQTQAILSHFGLQYGPDLDIEEVKVMAAALLPTQFHRDPKAIGPNAGHYRSPILARGVASIWMAGNKPTATRFPDALDPVPTLAIAYVAALTEDIIKRLAKDGCIKTEKKAKTEEEKRQKELERAAAKSRGEGGTRASVDPVRADMHTHLENLQLFEQIMGPDYHQFRSNLFKDACKWAGIYNGNSQPDDKKPHPSGKLTAASFADELKQAKARQAAAASGSRSDAQPSHKSPTDFRACPTPLSKLPEIEERAEDNSSISTTSARHASPSRFEEPPSPMPQHTKDVYEEGAPSNGGSGEGRLEQSIKPGGSDESEPEGDAEEQDGTGERESTSLSAGKRKSREEPGRGNFDDLPSENEEPMKKRRLLKTPQVAVPQSDEEEDQGDAQDDVGGDGRELKTPAKPSTTDILLEANDDLPPGGTVPGGAVPSSPLSESPNDSPAVVKRATRLSSQVAKDASSAKEAMVVGLEKRKQEEIEKRKRTAQRKKEEEDAKKAEDMAFKELERQAKEAKLAGGKTKAGATKRAPRKKK
ncbi:hypothetical protein RhiJN_11644 [Ceratobasidium sp. AG-Ba]|nr:hypothetical protein RhiJN_11644 [Ceratobasidium sp. AG-Ba]